MRPLRARRLVVRIRVSAVNLELSPALRQYAEVRVWLALQRFSRRVRWVKVWLSRCNDTPGGEGWRCRLGVWLGRLGLVVVEHTDADAYVAIDAAAIRLKQAVLRRLKS